MLLVLLLVLVLLVVVGGCGGGCEDGSWAARGGSLRGEVEAGCAEGLAAELLLFRVWGFIRVLSGCIRVLSGC